MLSHRLSSLASASDGHRSRLQWHLAIATRESALAPCGLGALDQGTNVKGEDVALGFARRFWHLAKSFSVIELSVRAPSSKGRSSFGGRLMPKCVLGAAAGVGSVCCFRGCRSPATQR